VTIGDPWYGIIGAVSNAVLPGYITLNNVSVYLSMAFGLFATTFALQANRAPTVPRFLRDVIDRLGGRPLETPISSDELEQLVTEATITENEQARVDRDAVGAAPASVSTKSGLSVRGLEVRYGGVRAVDNVSIDAPMGRITGLVGPNGAGKTTTFNACSGLVKPTAGDILLHDRKVTSMGPADRSRFGLGRTFQKAELFNSLTVRENVALGREASMAGANPLTQLVGNRRDRAVVKQSVDEAIALTGIGLLANLQAGLLPTGQRRLVELARVLAGPFDFLLLDEPSAGLDAGETVSFGNVLSGVVAVRGTGILLVEHDMALVRQVCSRIYLLDFGRLVFEGSPEEMLTSEVVRSAYLGYEDLAGDKQARPSSPIDQLTQP
jgi:ABC-type branched-subunit amino acid transport system ATPase component